MFAATIFLVIVLVLPYYVRRYLRLRYIPGPPLAAFTDLWRARAHNSPEYSLGLSKLHEKYGKLVRIGPNFVSIGDPNAVPIIYGTKPVWEKAPSYGPATPVTSGKAVPSIIAMTEAQHTAVRKSVGRAFTTNALLDYEEFIDQSAIDLTNGLRKNKTVDLTKWFHLYAMDVINRIAFSDSLGFLQKGGDVDGIIAATMHRFDHWNKWAALPGLEYLLMKSPLTKFKKRQDSPLARVSLVKLKGRMGSKPSSSGGKDLLQYFFDGQDKYSDLISQEEVLGMIMSTISAGADTTAGTFATTVFFLMKHPSVLSKLREELQTHVNDGTLSNPPQWSEVHRLPYLEAVLKESMRYYPVISFGIDRIVPPEGATIAGQFIPGGTVVGCQMDAVHNDPTVYGENTREFRPERWLEADEDRKKKMDRAFLSFSAGKRICLGIHIAWLELKKVIPLLVMNFDMTLDNPDQDLIEGTRISSIRYPGPIMATLSERRITAVSPNA